MGSWKRWSVVAGYGLAMGWLEAAVVVYLRTWMARIEPLQPDPLPMIAGISRIEMLREAATLVMIAAVGWLAGQTRRSRLGYALVIFGTWDLSYYLFLKVVLGWPSSLLAWDILFLLPLPWWGPVLAPVAIAVLMIAAGILLVCADLHLQSVRSQPMGLVAASAGTTLALAIFLSDAARALPDGEQAVRRALPTTFAWPQFMVALVLMAVPVVDLALKLRGQILPARRTHYGTSEHAGRPAEPAPDASVGANLDS